MWVCVEPSAIYISIYIYIYIYIYISIWAYIYIYIYICVCVCLCEYVYMCVYACVCVFVRERTCNWRWFLLSTKSCKDVLRVIFLRISDYFQIKDLFSDKDLYCLSLKISLRYFLNHNLLFRKSMFSLKPTVLCF